MGDYDRSTRACSFSDLRPELVVAIRDYCQKADLGAIESEIIMCAETTSVKKKKGFLASLISSDPDKQHYTGMLVTPTRLIWARSGAKYGQVVSAARLKDIEVRDFDSRLVEDTGLDVFGFVGDSPERVTAFIGLGPEPAARQFRDAVIDAVAKAGR